MKYLGAPQSGSQANLTASRNRNGQYIRSRAIPVNPRSAKQGAVRARLAASAAIWRTLTADGRAGWADLAAGFHRKDSLGQDYTPTGFQMFCSVNNNLIACSLAGITAAPALVTPPSLTSATVTLTAASFSIAYTVTPLAASTYLMAFASPQRSAGRAFEGDFRLISFSTAAQASPMIILSPYTSRFGVPVVGNRIFLSLVTMCGGFVSGPLITSAVVA
jgi:hypothetical protein